MDDPNKIGPGDLVRVHGIVGPKMIVEGVTTHGVQTLWFDRKWALQSSVFDPAKLFKVPPRERHSDEMEHADATE
jgi:uncharacterized protein YodC (DUF2158 family)